MNDVIKVLESRRSCRNFKPEIEGDYEGIGHCALGYAAEPAKEAAPRKENYVYCI